MTATATYFKSERDKQMADEQSKSSSSTVTNERVENFISTYANSILFETSAWDLKLIFGQLDQSTTPNHVKQHLAVTIPWPQAKLFAFWLRVQVEFGEISVNAKIPIRKDLLPQELPPLTEEQKKDPDAKRFREWYDKARKEFLKTV